MTREKDKAVHDAASRREARTRQAKGSVQEAIGKIIGSASIEKQGLSESKAGAMEAEAQHSIDRDSVDSSPIDRDGNK